MSMERAWNRWAITRHCRLIWATYMTMERAWDRWAISWALLFNLGYMYEHVEGLEY